MHPARSMRLRFGEKIATLGHGTRLFAGSPARRAEQVASVRLDVDLGMTAIDAAEMYSNCAAEALVGEVISGRRSEEFLVAEELPHRATRVGTVRAYEALGGLGVDYIDLHLPHWRGRIPLVETIEGFAELQLYGMLRYRGVSNLDVDDMIELSGVPGGDEVQTNQILYNLTRRHPACALLPWPAQHGIPTIAYSPIEHRWLLEYAALQTITQQNSATPAQIMPATKAPPSCDGGVLANNASEMA
jgi:diketogulonate reductase-like aldo/keto reductase